MIYYLLFTFPINYIEHTLTSKPQTLASSFWNQCTLFISLGYTKYIGILFIILALTIAFFSLKSKKYDEYQLNGLLCGLICCGLITILLIPICLLLILSDRNYVIEIIYVIATIDWLTVMTVDLIFVIKNSF